MAMKGRTATTLLLLLAQLLFDTNAIRFNIVNNCPYSIWMGANPAIGLLSYEISSGVLFFQELDDRWRGQLYFRTHCGLDSSLNFHCKIGDCDFQECDGKEPHPPITILDFLSTSSNKSFYSYSVNLERGFNVPASIAPKGGDSCQPVGCSSDLISVCPPELQIIDEGKIIGCNSNCGGFGNPEDCCTGDFSGFGACKPSQSAKIFKQSCPQAHTWTYDDGVRSCAATSFDITLCP